jgi:hypothetical protein
MKSVVTRFGRAGLQFARKSRPNIFNNLVVRPVAAG